MKTRYGAVALLLVGILVLSLALTAALGVHRDTDEKRLTVVASASGIRIWTWAPCAPG